MNRIRTAKFRMSDRKNEDLTPGSPAERIGLVWPLTRELASLSKRYDAERRLQRHVTTLRGCIKTPRNDYADASDLTTGASRIGKFTSAASAAKAMSAYHIQP